MAAKRDKLEIIYQILQTCSEGSTKTNIVYRVNLNFKTVRPYLDILVENGLMEVQRDSSMVYTTTDKGLKLMKDLRNINHRLNPRRD